MSDCNLQQHPNDPELLQCPDCLRTVKPHIFDISQPLSCCKWWNALPSEPLPTLVKHDHAELMESPPPKNLAVITSYFNFAGWKSIEHNYLRFTKEMEWWGVPYFAAEIAVSSEKNKNASFLTPAYITVAIRPEEKQYILWQKEQLLNLIVQNLPSRYDAIAWIDADVIFTDRYWYQRTIDALATKPVVQMYRQWHFSGSDGELCLSGHSVGENGEFYRKGKGHPGGAWAARRGLFPLYPFHVLGGGDTLAVESWLNIEKSYLQKQMSPDWLANYKPWYEHQHRLVNGEIGMLRSDALHLYHGSRNNRLYSTRSRWLQEANYSPKDHANLADNGLVQWTSQVPEQLKSRVYQYLTLDRKEDE
jgi:hypothetical protein